MLSPVEISARAIGDIFSDQSLDDVDGLDICTLGVLPPVETEAGRETLP